MIHKLYTADIVLPGPAGESVTDGAVLVEGETITAVGPRTEIEKQAAPGTPVEHFHGGTILPGIVNSHIHLVFHGGPKPADVLQSESDDSRLVLKMAARANTLLRSGVTTARDLGDRDGLALRVRDAIAADEIPGPRILAATTPLTPPQGHCWFLGGEVSGEHEIRARIQHLAGRGADAIKIMASGGESTPGPYAMWDPQFTIEELRAAVDEAHGAGLTVAAHAHSAEGVARVVDAGVDTVEHATWLVAGPDWDPRPEVAQQMAEQGTILCHASSNDWRRLAAVAGEDWARRLGGRVAWFDSFGVTQIAGTDAGITGFGDSPAALARFADYGFSPARAIEIGTVAGATALGLAGTTGALRAGLAADLLIVQGNPLVDLTALTNTVRVVARGHQYTPEQAEPDR